MSEIVSFEKRGSVAFVRLDDGKANAISMAVIEGLSAALERAAAEAKAIVLTGRAGRFSAGFDLRVMMSDPDAATSLVLAGGEMLLRLYDHPQPVVVACSGHAIAAGVLMVAAGDRRIGVTGEFKLGLNEVANGMPVPILAHELARERLDPRALVESVLHARLYDPEAAVRAGWLDRVVAPDALEATAMEEAETLARLSQPAYGQTKRSMRRAMITHCRATMAQNLAELRAGT